MVDMLEQSKIHAGALHRLKCKGRTNTHKRNSSMENYQALDIDGHKVLVDDQDIHLLSKYTWRVRSVGAYVKKYLRSGTSKKGEKIHFSFHRLVMGAARGEIVDHINGDSLDNRRANLRLVTCRQNNTNRAHPFSAKSKFNGVGWSNSRWQVSIRHNGKQIYIGRFDSEIEAAYHYDLASLKYHGEYGRRNFLPLVFE